MNWGSVATTFFSGWRDTSQGRRETQSCTIVVKGNYDDTSMNLFHKRLDLRMLKLDKMKKAE